MTFTPKVWNNLASGGTKLNAAAIVDLETRVTAYTDATKTEAFTLSGELYVLTGQGRYYFPATVAITSVRISVGTAPTSASIIVDVNKNGTTIFTTQANRPTIAASGNVSSVAVPDVTAFTTSDYLTVDIDQVGSLEPGADLTVQVLYS